MTYEELTVTVLLKRDIRFVESSYIIGKTINKSMLLNADLKALHPKQQFKHYVFNSFSPLEKEKVYFKDKLYFFKVRGMDPTQMEKMKYCLQNVSSADFTVVSVSLEIIKQKHIRQLKSIMPVIVTVDDSPWMQNQDLDVFVNRLESNLEKKYKSIFDKSIDINDKFIKAIHFTNRTPMALEYKNIRLLGHKVVLDIQDNPEAQDIAFLAVALGIGEKNSALGSGFCNSY